MDKNGLVRIAPLLGWRNLYPAEFLEKALPVPVAVMAENDANAFAIGATYGRAAPESGVTLFLVLESGVGGGIIVDGVLLRGAHGLAGEIGHLKVLEGEPGRTLEQVIGLESLIVAYRESRTAAPPGFEKLVADVRDRVPRAIAVAEEWAKALAFGLVQACRIIDPDRIVLGGSVAALYPLVAKRVAAYMQQAQEGSFPSPEITVNGEAIFGGAFGAACMMHQRFLTVDAVRYVEDATPVDVAQ
jgi:predicted NBD/HSP70 family sugar kinase